jgi:SHS2 domain-containing protein
VPARRASSAPDVEAGHELVDHTSEITIRFRAPTYGSLIEEATRAFGELVPAPLRGSVVGEPREFRVGGPDRAATLVEWLNELVYLCEVERWLAVDSTVTEEDGARLHIRARGVSLNEPFVWVKAATLHRAFVEEGPDGLVAEVTLDV